MVIEIAYIWLDIETQWHDGVSDFVPMYWRQEEELREKEEFGPSPTQADTFLCLCWPFANGNRARS